MRSLATVVSLATVALALNHADLRAQSDAASRYRAWRAGSELSTTVLLHTAGMSRDDVRQRNRRVTAYLGVEIPPPPMRTGTEQDSARILQYVMNSLGPAVASRLHGEDLLLFEIAFKSNLVLLHYTPENGEPGMLKMIRERAGKLRLPRSAWEPFATALEARASYADVRAALIRTHSAVSAALRSAMTPPPGETTETETDRLERESIASQYVQEEATKLWIVPVIAALKRAATGDAVLTRLLDEVRFTSTRYYTRPANAYATPASVNSAGVVEIDQGWFHQAMAAAYLEAFDILDPGGQRGLVRRAGQAFGATFGAAISKGGVQPNFWLKVGDYIDDATELKFVSKFAETLTTEAIAWTVLHEIAHHRLGHPPASEGTELSIQREREYQADEWACRKMLDLGVPLHGPWALIQLLAAVFGAQNDLVVLPAEESSTHPTWQHRRERLEKSFTFSATTNRRWVVFHSVANLAASGSPADIAELAYFFPHDPARFGMCTGTANRVGEAQAEAAVERTEFGTHLYQRTSEGFLVDSHIVEPGRAVTHIVTKVTDPKTGEKWADVRIAWEEPVCLDPGWKQVPSPKGLYRSALVAAGIASTARRQAIAAFDRKLDAYCQITIAAGKGQLAAKEAQARADAASRQYQTELSIILDPQARARLAARLTQMGAGL